MHVTTYIVIRVNLSTSKVMTVQKLLRDLQVHQLSIYAATFMIKTVICSHLYKSHSSVLLIEPRYSLIGKWEYTVKRL